MPRKSLGKSKRFEIFKRDNFYCQYCGNHPPHVVLEIDHIKPVIDGGNNELYNLITSCFDCNRGKGARSLKIVPKSIAKQAAEISEREAQIIGFQRVIAEQQQRLKDDSFEILDYLGMVSKDGTAYKSHIVSVKNFLKRMAFHEVMECAEICVSKGKMNNFSYFCGICWNVINKKENNTDG